LSAHGRQTRETRRRAAGGRAATRHFTARLPSRSWTFVSAASAIGKSRDDQADRRVHGGPGAYLRILREGEIGAGDQVDITARPAQGVTIARVARAILLDETELAAAAAAPELPASLSRWMLGWVA
jgi:MOSC domain-containing protein YiiM